MISLFTKEGLVALESLTFTRTLYAFDFDGTLAPIVNDPASAKISPSTAALLRQLSDLAPVAIISGRSVADLKRILPFRPQYLVGNHGLEGLKRSRQSLANAQATCTQWIERLRRAPIYSGVDIEDKKLSLAIHYRRSRQRTLARQKIEKLITTLTPPPRVVPGKCVYNLIPSGAPHKGMALLDLLPKSRTRHVFYVGDDDTDEDVFSLPYVDGQLLTVRVGRKQVSQARYFLQRQSEINRLIRTLVRYHSRQKQLSLQRKAPHA
ncbi:MAG: trehalose-phosphatase [Bdellovibrionales bacterium]|nr:trehalose-phosphatase [Bdellovibrionales bacterium]